MAEDELREKRQARPDLGIDETDDIERLIAEEEAREREAFKIASLPRKVFLWVRFNRTAVLKYGIMTMALVAVLGTVYYVFFIVNQGPVESEVVSKPPEQEILPFDKPNVYRLKPFFMPITSRDGKETGRFLKVQISLLLSNNKLDEELDKQLPNIRSDIYRQLSRKTLEDFESRQRPIKDRLKKEIKMMSNSFLVRGTGTVTDVLFTEFVVTTS